MTGAGAAGPDTRTESRRRAPAGGAAAEAPGRVPRGESWCVRVRASVRVSSSLGMCACDESAAGT